MLPSYGFQTIGDCNFYQSAIKNMLSFIHSCIAIFIIFFTEIYIVDLVFALMLSVCSLLTNYTDIMFSKL